MTKSEKLFEDFCSNKSIYFERIHPEENVRKADYFIWRKNYKLIVEITQLDLNDEEKELLQKMKTQKSIAYWPSTEDRIRQKIKDKKDQIKNLVNKHNLASLLIIFDNREILTDISNDSMKYAMYGKDSHVIYYQGDLENSWYGGDKFGGSRRLTKNQKKYISALGNLYFLKSKLKLAIYHNYYAVNPIDIDRFKLFADYQYKIENPHNGNQKDWCQIK